MDDEDETMMPAPMMVQPKSSFPIMSRRERKKAMAEAEKLLRAQYDAGVPLFTKAQLQDLAEQIDQCMREDNPRQEILVKGLDGETITFPFRKGKDHGRHGRRDDLRRIATKPTLDYCSIEHLLFNVRDEHFYNPALAYLPVIVAIETEIRNTSTGEVLDFSAPTTTDYAAVREKFYRERRRWEGSDCFAQLRACLTSRNMKIPAGVNKVVAFALGCMSWAEQERVEKDGDRDDDEDAWESDAVESSMAQHSLMLAVRDLLVQRDVARGEVKCCAQEPVYTGVDKRILGEEGVTVLEDPKGFLEVDDNCVVVSASPNVPVRQIVADIARPAVLIWDEGVEEEHDGERCTDPVSKRVAKMMEGYVQLPWSSEERAFEFLAVYARKDLVQDKAPYGPKL